MPTIEIEAPRGAKILVLQVADDVHVSPQVVEDLSTTLREKFKRASERNEWPITLFLTKSWNAHWLEAE